LVRLRNCPFQPFAAADPDLCRLDHAVVSGVLEGLHAESAADAVLVPPPGACCVELRPR
jgi:predicted ArsR family transcriptional regulator